MEIHPDKYCVYLHRLPDCTLYIGKGRSYRPFEASRRNSLWKAKVAEAGSFTVEILDWFDDEADAKIFEAKAIREMAPLCNMMLNGWERTPEEKAKISAAHKGKRVSAETRNKISLARKTQAYDYKPWNKGMVYNEELRNRLMDKCHMLGKPFKVRNTETAEIFHSVSQAAKSCDIPKSTLLQHLSGKLKHARGCVFEKVY